MSLQSVAHPDIAKVHSMLSKMDGPQLQQFAAAHQDNAIYVSLAMQVDKDRKEEMQRLQALMTGREQPKVISQAVAALSPQSMIPPGMGGQGGAPMPPPGGPQGPMPPQGMPPQGGPGMQMPPAAPPVPQAPPSGPSAAQPGIAALPAPNMQGMADGGIAGYADGDEAVGYAEGGVPRYDGAETSVVRAPNISMTPTSERALTGQELWANQPPMYDYLMGDDSADAQEKAQRAKDRLAMGSGLGKAYAAAKDVLTLPGRGVAGAFETAVTRPLRAAGVPMPYLPESFYGGDRSSATPYMDAIRQQEQKAAASGQLPLPAGVKPAQGRGLGVGEYAQPFVKPAGEEAAAAPTQTYAGIYDLVSRGGGRPSLSVGAGAGIGAGMKGPPTLAMPDKLTAAKAMENVGQFFDTKDLYAQADKARAEALGRAEETAQFVKFNKPGLPFQELAKKLDTEEFNEIGEKEKARGMALMMAGFKMMESPYGGKGLGAFLRNMGAGATVGAKELQQANKEFKELAQKRMQMRVTIEAAQDAAKRGDFDREIALRTRADQISDRAEDLKAQIAQTAWGNKAQGALSAFQHSENVYNQFKIADFNAKNEAYNTQLREAGATTRSNAQIAAQRQSDLFKASLPPESLRAAAILGGAKPGETGTPEQIKAGLTLINSEKFNPQAAYSKYLTEWKSNPMKPEERMLTYPEYLAMFGAGKVVDKLPANALVRNPQ